MTDFYELPKLEAWSPANGALPRSQQILDAIAQNSDYDLIGTLKTSSGVQQPMQVVLVEVTCDGVPSHNRPGIEYRERLALVVGEDPKRQVEVLALRKSFPILMHQNNGSRNGPASLCLYFEPAESIARTWTAQKFLRRIQWWLEESAKERLHAADQPLDHLFFASNYELVLPWNFNELCSQGARLLIEAQQTRPDGGQTFFVRHTKDRNAGIAPLQVTLSPVVHGFVERDPTTLGELSDILHARGAELLGPLRQAIKNAVTEKGVAKGQHEPYLVIILHIPICREAGLDPERTVRRAFLSVSGAYALGQQVGALTLHEGRYYSEVDSPLFPNNPGDAWRNMEISAVSVLQAPNRSSARAQSAIADVGPKGLLLGAGALGSSLMDLFVRAGWGTWAVADKDHLKPHNVVRHMAMADQVGVSKAMAVAQLAHAAMCGAQAVRPIVADACDTTNAELLNAVQEAELVIDATTTLEYPRLASTRDSNPRHATVFLTPSGNGAVMLLEDRSRSKRLRTLEAQYYRKIIQSPWGRTHLSGNLQTYWTGASCRDISVALGFSKVVAHAATLAEQLMSMHQGDVAASRIWERDPDTGTVTTYAFAPDDEIEVELDGMSVYFDTGLDAQLNQYRQQALPNETGGVLLGYYDFNVNSIVIVEALPAPADSVGRPGSFERGTEGLMAQVMDANNRTAGIVGYIGEWHSHPPGHSANPSRDDIVQLAQLAVGMKSDGLPALQLIVGEDGIRILKGAFSA